jgi:CDP-diacylglycerol--glycerol-3-phosphate 3-phosphatidyltransferase
MKSPDLTSDSIAAAATQSSRLVRDLRTIPNLMSLSRLVLITLSVIFYINGFPITGLTLGFLCGLSDYLDGYIARRAGQVTELGEILDRLGDLVFEIWAFTFTVYFDILPPYLFMAYILREIVVMSARQYVSEHRHPDIEMKTSFFGKLKTNFLGYSFLVMFLVHARVIPLPWLNELLHWLSVAGVVAGLLWSYIAGYQYLRAFVRTYDIQ